MYNQFKIVLSNCTIKIFVAFLEDYMGNCEIHILFLKTVHILYSFRASVRAGAMGAIAPVNFWQRVQCTRQFSDTLKWGPPEL